MNIAKNLTKLGIFVYKQHNNIAMHNITYNNYSSSILLVKYFYNNNLSSCQFIRLIYRVVVIRYLN